MKVFLLGSDAFSVFAARGLRRAREHAQPSVWAVRPKTPRNDPLKLYCEEQRLPFAYLERGEDDKPDYAPLLQRAELEAPASHVLLACSFGSMVPTRVIDAFSASYVVHPSLLPKFRGAAPIAAALLHGEEVSGVSVVGMSRQSFDAGPVFLQKELPVPVEFVFTDLFQALGLLARDAVAELLHRHEELATQGRPQEAGTAAPKLQPGQNRLEPQRMSAEEIVRRFRAFTGSTLKNVYCELPGTTDRLIFKQLRAVKPGQRFCAAEGADALFPPGVLFNAEKQFRRSLVLAAREGFVEVADAVLASNSALRFGLLRPRLIPPERWDAFITFQRMRVMDAQQLQSFKRLLRTSLALK